MKCESCGIEERDLVKSKKGKAYCCDCWYAEHVKCHLASMKKTEGKEEKV